MARVACFASRALVALVALAGGSGCERPRRFESRRDVMPAGTPREGIAAESAKSAPAGGSRAPVPISDAAAAGSSGGRAAMAPVACARDANFPEAFGVAEASAAAEVELSTGIRELVIVSDSGHKGAAAAWNLGTGGVRKLVLPLDDAASDDLEGAAWLRDSSGGHLYTLTSSGAVRRFSPSPTGSTGDLRRDHDAYPLGPPPAACADLHAFNCGRNYEGLCLRATGTQAARCAGYAASKAESRLYCLVFENGRLVADAIKPPLRLALRKNSLSDCAFGAAGGPAQGALVVTTNVYDGSTTYVVDEATGGLSPIDVPGTPNNEALAIDHEGALYQFMDTNGDVSPAYRHRCTGW